MKKPLKKEKLVYKPHFEGGDKAINEFITARLQYPPAAKDGQIEGTVHVNYSVDHKGKVIDTKIISGFDHECEKEAQRLVALLQFTVPNQPRGLRVMFHKDIFIHFRLPKSVINASSPAPFLHYVLTPPAAAKAPASKNGLKPTAQNYQIVIRLNK